jgi:hypothetical protein
MNEDAYEQGKKAALEGVNFYDNPYVFSRLDKADLFRVWFGGWCEGAQEKDALNKEVKS